MRDSIPTVARHAAIAALSAALLGTPPGASAQTREALAELILEHRHPMTGEHGSLAGPGFAALREAFAGSDEGVRIVDAMAASARIYRLWRSANYENNRQRVLYMKRNLVDGLRRWKDSGRPPPKVLMKFGSFHMGRGLSPANQYDLGAPAQALAVVRGIADPNFVLVREDGSFLVSDDFTHHIYAADTTGELLLIAEGMPHIASLVFGEGEFDRTALYVTSTFRGGGTIWKVPVGVRGAPVVRGPWA